MKQHLLTPIPALIMALTTLTSCIMTTVVQEIEDTVIGGEVHYTSKAATHPMGTLILEIQNNAENTLLQIDSLEICNIQLADTIMQVAQKGNLALINTPLQLPYGADTTITAVNIPAQTLTPWNQATLPTLSQNTYAKIHGTIYSYLLNNEPYSIYSGSMYYPILGTITQESSIPITITLQPNCPLYSLYNNTPVKVLQPITFTVTITDWE